MGIKADDRAAAVALVQRACSGLGLRTVRDDGVVSIILPPPAAAYLTIGGGRDGVLTVIDEAGGYHVAEFNACSHRSCQQALRRMPGWLRVMPEGWTGGRLADGD